MTAAAKKLPYKPLDLIPRHGVTHLAADGDPQSGFSAVIVFVNNDKIRGVDLFAGSRKSKELRSFSQAGRFRKSFSALRRHSSALTCALV